MNPDRKTPANSFLKQLPKEVRDQLFDVLEKSTYEAAAAWLRTEGGYPDAPTSPSTYSRFRSWHAATRFLQDGREAADAFSEWLADAKEAGQMPGISLEEIRELGQLTFLATSLKKGDAKVHARFQELALKADSNHLQREKLAATQKIVDDETLTPETTAAKLKELFGRK